MCILIILYTKGIHVLYLCVCVCLFTLYFECHCYRLSFIFLIFFFFTRNKLLNEFLFCFFKVPEDNVERLRNIRDMFENPNQLTDEQSELQKVEKLIPSDKIKDIFLKYLILLLLMFMAYQETFYFFVFFICLFPVPTCSNMFFHLKFDSTY